MFHEFVNRYVIEGKLVAATALHVGAAEDVFSPGGCKNPFFRNAEGLPLIPGSSLKGAMRSFLEQYLSSESGKKELSGVMHYRKDICDEEKRCGDPQTDGELKEKLESKDADASRKVAEYLFGAEGEGENGKGALCIVCRLFGSPSSAAKFNVRDAGVIEETFQNGFEIRSGVSIDRDFGTAVDGRTYTVEVVPAGTKFSFCAVLENGDEMEWKIIGKLLRAMETGLISLGGMKSRGLGEVRLEEVTYLELNGKNIAEYLTGEKIRKHNL